MIDPVVAVAGITCFTATLMLRIAHRLPFAPQALLTGIVLAGVFVIGAITGQRHP